MSEKINYMLKGFIVRVYKVEEYYEEGRKKQDIGWEPIFAQEMPSSFSVPDLARHLNDQDKEWALARYKAELQGDKP